jgi:hypothetical protein
VELLAANEKLNSELFSLPATITTTSWWRSAVEEEGRMRVLSDGVETDTNLISFMHLANHQWCMIERIPDGMIAVTERYGSWERGPMTAS